MLQLQQFRRSGTLLLQTIPRMHSEFSCPSCATDQPTWTQLERSRKPDVAYIFQPAYVLVDFLILVGCADQSTFKRFTQWDVH